MKSRTMQLCLLAVLCGAVASHSPPTPVFSFSNVYGDEMVLQSAPQRAVVWGICPGGNDSVTVTFGTTVLPAKVALYGGNWTWSVSLPPTAASFAEHTVTAKSRMAGRAITLANVLFGDVWVCSGQSNSE
jgi:sialate O-acetylesterase